MSTICYPENRNSFVIEDWKTVGVSSQGITAPMRCAPKQLVTFTWSLGSSSPTTSAQQYRAAIDSLYEHRMTKKESAYFRRQMASKFVPLTLEETRLLPPRAK
jgi:hypothetical protein